ncbi:hypothetical protein SAMN04488112_10198 [Melghirimyces thermohalophilus]|uniref:Uncharacterized protein n=1 Tax=Melghirimyces thermohalophilus TaxID=1236220 RepID=A0A1G6HN93_9BACL|nr:pilus assembly PilX N-terminal domain-containing protein [Melghirimyces thermohalophilus]SDB95598.1 hypothetical protein SAMN04488112_10198 [Melghirimyces thermohalophilus]
MKDCTWLKDERGMALPFALAVTVLAFLLTSTALSSYSRSLQAANTDWARIQAQYAAESGLARMRQRVCADPNGDRPLSTPLNGFHTRSTVEKTEDGIFRIRSVAQKENVKQSIAAELDPRTCTIRRWEP